MFHMTDSKGGVMTMTVGTNTTTTGVRPDIDALIRSMWDACPDMDGEGLEIKARHDQWWGVTVTCEHGTWLGHSDGVLDLSTAFARLHEQFVQGHED